MWRFNSIVVLVIIWLGDGSRFNKSCLHDLGVPNHHCYRVSSQLLVKFISDMVRKCFGNESLKDLTMERIRVEEFEESLR